MMFKVVEKNPEPRSSVQTEEQSSSTSSSNFSGVNAARHKETSSPTTSTASSSLNSGRQKERPLFSISPVRHSNQKMPLRTQRYSDASEKDKKLPPLPTTKPKIRIIDYSKENKVKKENQIHRSTSTREFRSQNQKEHLKLYVVDD